MRKSLLSAFIVLAFGWSISFAPPSQAGVTLPWSTTFNCNDWSTSNGLYNVNCDGLTGDGDGATADGKEEQITSAANYPGGNGGSGQRHWQGDGVNNTSGGLRITFGAPQNELWIRWYMRYELGFQWNPLAHDKILYLDPGPIHAVIPEFYGQEMNIAKNKSPNNQLSTGGKGWNAIMVNGGTDARGNKMSDGQWHLYEIHLRMDTHGADGSAEFWVDGGLVLSYR